MNRIYTVLLIGSISVFGITACKSGGEKVTMTPEAFVNKLVSDANSSKIDGDYRTSELAKAQSQQAGYIVIWDGHDKAYLAVNLSQFNVGNLDQNVMAFVYADKSNPQTGGIVVTQNGTSLNGAPLFVSSNGTAFSRDSQTKDVDLERADLQSSQMAETAAAVSRSYQMDFHAAYQLTLLSDKVRTLMSERELTSDDRRAITDSLAGIAGLSSDELDRAVTAGIQGDHSSANAMIEKAAQNLGMPSSATLRDRILPALGMSLN